MTYQTTPPAGGDILTDMLARYFRPGLVDRLVRTWVPVAIGSALSWANAHWSVLWLPDKPSDTTMVVASGVTIAGYYWAASLVEKRWPRLGRWLVALNLTKARPTYAEPGAAAKVEAAAARTPGRRH